MEVTGARANVIAAAYLVALEEKEDVLAVRRGVKNLVELCATDVLHHALHGVRDQEIVRALEFIRFLLQVPRRYNCVLTAVHLSAHHEALRPTVFRDVRVERRLDALDDINLLSLLQLLI